MTQQINSTREVKLAVWDNEVTTETLDNLINELKAIVEYNHIYDICIKLKEWNISKDEWRAYKE